MNKSELIDAVATTAGLTKADASRAVTSIIDTIIQSVKRNQEVRIVGFGTFLLSHRPATEARNPRTGEKIKVAASKQMRFRVSKTIKEALA